MQNATVQQPLTTVFPDSNPIVVLLQVEAGFISKHYVDLFRCSCPPLIALLAAQMPVVSSLVLGCNGCLADIPPYWKKASNGTSGHRMMRNKLNLFCYGS
ncbi:hypothetical protein TNCV_2370681 [Trichonephila clavipes]|nr:hypothetical protein TNCV_2370681 [Trichonephila clavipes]